METKHENLNTFVTQISNNLSEQQGKSSGSMPSNTVINPKSLNAITLRSGKKIGAKKVSFKENEEDEETVDEEMEVESPPANTTQENSQSIQSESIQEKKLMKKSLKQPVVQNEEEATTILKRPMEEGSPSNSKGDEVKIRDLPFPNSYLVTKKIVDKKDNEELFEMFSKLEVNVPLLDLIKKMPKCAKFLKDLCTNKRKYRHSERIQLGLSVSALFKPQLPIKCKDPGSYTIPCTIGRTTVSHALLDLGAAINVMPTSVYKTLGIEALKDTSVVLGLADRTVRYPKGILEDILVQVKGLVFPADFYVLDMTNELPSESTLILGRPFLLTAETIINMKKGLITMGIGDQEVQFNLSEAMSHGYEDCSYLGVSLIECHDVENLHETEVHKLDCCNMGVNKI